MKYLIFVIAISLLTPLVMLIFGIVFLKKPPKSINSIYGFRTEYSMKSKEAWDFAHKKAGKLWLLSGVALIVLSVIVSIITYVFFKEYQDYVCAALCALQVAILILSTFPVELSLKRNFDEKGNKK